MPTSPPPDDRNPVGADAPGGDDRITPEMVRVVAALLHDWDYEVWEAPEHSLESSYDILAKQIIRLVLDRAWGRG